MINRLFLQTYGDENILKYVCDWSGIGIKGDSISKPIKLLKWYWITYIPTIVNAIVMISTISYDFVNYDNPIRVLNLLTIYVEIRLNFVQFAMGRKRLRTLCNFKGLSLGHQPSKKHNWYRAKYPQCDRIEKDFQKLIHLE